jgi:hypothetical protein
MADPDTPEQAPEDVPTGGTSVGSKARRSLSKSRRELNEDELTQSGVRLMMFDELDRLDAEVYRLGTYEEKYHTADKQIGILEEKRKRDIVVDAVHAVCVGLGVGFLMLIFTLPAEPSGQRWFAAVVGTVLLIAGIAVKVRGR